MRKERHFREDTKRQNMILLRQMLNFTSLIVTLAMLFDFIAAFLSRNQNDTERSHLQDAAIFEFCKNNAISQIEAFKVHNLEILNHAIRIND